MGTVIRKEVRKRGFFGWVFLTLFIVFNLFMLFSVFAGANGASQVPATTELEQSAKAVGSVIGIGLLLFVWACGSIVLGLLALVTRGQKTIVEEVSA
ncbi:hypothetical protein SAMN05892877_13211 [Rhizobium subbaraonis]|uniref:Uncharacterized protein n=1 Tax=Rhizobium subbaraonis TaxID=908946 RepID=A0A285V0L2_9HYPH|nr:hypothetical protein [Rhizobium subbaraonis]SOC47654.1 hypothetical protein SAMN05892877_13211 [Rhizobium subbaraonis]